MTPLREGFRHRGHMPCSFTLPLQRQTPLPPCPGVPDTQQQHQIASGSQNPRRFGLGGTWKLSFVQRQCNHPVPLVNAMDEARGVSHLLLEAETPCPVPTASKLSQRPRGPSPKPCVSCVVVQQHRQHYSPEKSNSLFRSTEKNVCKTWPVRHQRNHSE